MVDSGGFESLLLAVVILVGVPILLFRMFLGEKGFQIFKANMVLDFVRFVVTAPFRLMGYLFSVIFEAFVRWKSQSFPPGTSFLQFIKKLF